MSEGARVTSARQLQFALAVAAAVLIVGTALASAVIGSTVLDKPLYVFLEEPTQDGPDPWYSGFVSTLGALLWMSAAAVAFFTAGIVRDRNEPGAGFWLGIGMLSTILAIDDLFLLHEIVLPQHLPVTERIVVGTYAAALVILVVTYRWYVRLLPWLVGIIALGFFAISVGIDDLYGGGSHYEAMLFVEEGAKLCGIATWTLLLAWGGWSIVLAAPDERPTSPR